MTLCLSAPLHYKKDTKYLYTPARANERVLDISTNDGAFMGSSPRKRLPSLDVSYPIGYTPGMDTFGARLRTLRHRAGLTLAGMAERCRLPLGTIQKLDAGQRADPRASTLRALARGLSITVDVLLDGVDLDGPARR